MAGITIFGILGNLAFNMKIDDISKVVKSGTGLAFISYPDAISKLQFLPQVCPLEHSLPLSKSLQKFKCPSSYLIPFL